MREIFDTLRSVSKCVRASLSCRVRPFFCFRVLGGLFHFPIRKWNAIFPAFIGEQRRMFHLFHFLNEAAEHERAEIFFGRFPLIYEWKQASDLR